jgi:hypothetical protein
LHWNGLKFNEPGGRGGTWFSVCENCGGAKVRQTDRHHPMKSIFEEDTRVQNHQTEPWLVYFNKFYFLW